MLILVNMMVMVMTMTMDITATVSFLNVYFARAPCTASEGSGALQRLADPR